MKDLEVDEGVLAVPGAPDEEDEGDDEEAEAQRIQVAPNQSSSWPLSRMIWRQPVQTTRQAEAEAVEGGGLGRS